MLFELTLYYEQETTVYSKAFLEQGILDEQEMFLEPDKFLEHDLLFEQASHLQYYK